MLHNRTIASRLLTALIGIVFALMLVMPSFAAGESLSIEAAVQLAQAADIDYQIAALTWENAEIDDRTARAAGQMTPYDLLQQDLRVRKARHTFAQAHTDLVLGVIRDYINLIQATNQLEIRQRQLTVAEAELARLHEMVRIGNATEQDRLREVNKVVSAELSLASAERTYESRRTSFMKRLGLPDHSRVVLDDSLAVVPFNHSLEETLEIAREVSFDVWERGVNQRIAEMDLENLRSQNPAPLALQKAENTFQIQALNMAKSETQFVTQTTTAYHNAADAWTQLESSERDYLVAMETDKQAVRQYEAGLKTDLDMEKAEIDRLAAEQTIQDARNNYALLLLEFDLTLGIPLPYGEEALQ